MLSSVRNKEDQQRLKVSSQTRYFFTNLELKTFLSGQEHKERIIHASRRMDEVVDEHEHEHSLCNVEMSILSEVSTLSDEHE